MLWNQRHKGIFLIISFEEAWYTVQQYLWWDKQYFSILFSFCKSLISIKLNIMNLPFWNTTVKSATCCWPPSVQHRTNRFISLHPFVFRYSRIKKYHLLVQYFSISPEAFIFLRTMLPAGSFTVFEMLWW